MPNFGRSFLKHIFFLWLCTVKAGSKSLPWSEVFRNLLEAAWLCLLKLLMHGILVKVYQGWNGLVAGGFQFKHVVAAEINVAG